VPFDAAHVSRLRAWLEGAVLPPPPLETLPGVTAYNPALLRAHTLAELDMREGAAMRSAGVMTLRWLAHRYGPPDVRALAAVDDLAVGRGD
jgi:hypothetical protein